MAFFAKQIPCSLAKITDEAITTVLEYLPDSHSLLTDAIVLFSLLNLGAKKEVFTEINLILDQIDKFIGFTITQEERLSLFVHPTTPYSRSSILRRLNELDLIKNEIALRYIQLPIYPQELTVEIRLKLNYLREAFFPESVVNRELEPIISQIESAILPNYAAKFAPFFQISGVRHDRRGMFLEFLNEANTENLNAIHFEERESVGYIPSWNMPYFHRLDSPAQLYRAPQISDETGERRSGTFGGSPTSHSTSPLLSQSVSDHSLCFMLRFLKKPELSSQPISINIGIALANLSHEIDLFKILPTFISVLGEEEIFKESPPPPPPAEMHLWEQFDYYVNLIPLLKRIWEDWIKERKNRADEPKALLSEQEIKRVIFSLIGSLKTNLRKAFYQMPLSAPNPPEMRIANQVAIASEGSIYTLGKTTSLVPHKLNGTNNWPFSTDYLDSESLDMIYDKIVNNQANEQVEKIPSLIVSKGFAGSEELCRALLSYKKKYNTISLQLIDLPEQRIEIKYNEFFNKNDFAIYLRHQILMLKSLFYKESSIADDSPLVSVRDKYKRFSFSQKRSTKARSSTTIDGSSSSGVSSNFSAVFASLRRADPEQKA